MGIEIINEFGQLQELKNTLHGRSQEFNIEFNNKPTTFLQFKERGYTLFEDLVKKHNKLNKNVRFITRVRFTRHFSGDQEDGEEILRLFNKKVLRMKNADAVYTSCMNLMQQDIDAHIQNQKTHDSY